MCTKLLVVIQSLLCILLIFTALIGDFLVHYYDQRVYKALCDNSTHAIIAALSWIIVCMNFQSNVAIFEVFSCAAIASLIDLDHFYKARSLHLKDATSIKSRPPLHCSSFPLAICAVLLVLSYQFQMRWLQRVTLLIFTAVFSHHTRDATRRGFWFCPFGSTDSISKFQYVLLTCLIPYFVCYILKFVELPENKRQIYIV